MNRENLQQTQRATISQGEAILPHYTTLEYLKIAIANLQFFSPLL